MSSRALPSPRSSADASAWALCAAGAALGIAAESSLYGWADPRHWIPDLLTGWCLIACGVIGWRRRESWSAVLLAAGGFAWFAGNFSAHALFLHRGPLVAAVLTYPTGRAAGRTEGVAVAAVSVAAATTVVGLSEYATIAIAASLVAVAALGYRSSIGSEQRRRFYALRASAFLAAVLAETAALHLAFAATDWTLLVYEASLCALAIALFVGLLRAPWERSEVTDLVIEVGTTRSGSIRSALGRALGDPTLEIAYPLLEGGYVDHDGRRVELPAPSSARRATSLTREGAEIAVLVHDRAVLDDPELVEAVAAAARLANANARLQMEVRSQVDEVRASRRRLVDAADEERRRLEARLADGAARRLASLQRTLHDAERDASTETRPRIERAEDQTARAIADLNELAAGLHPRELAEGGLAVALAALASRAPVPVQLKVSSARLPPEIEAAAYYVCSEALANVAKYAAATRLTVTVTVTKDARTVKVEVADDGAGGADPSRGSGLRGLADRLEALGGTLTVESAPGQGTRLIALMPFSDA